MISLQEIDRIILGQLVVPIEQLMEIPPDFLSGLLDISYQNNLELKTLTKEFLKLRQTAHDKYYGYEVMSDYGEYAKNYRHRVFFFKIDNDFVCVFAKLVDLQGRGRYFTVYHPISLTGNRSNEVKVLKALSSFHPVLKVSVIRSECSPNIKAWDCNFYNTRESCEFMFKSKFRSKRGIAKMSSMIEVRMPDMCDDKLLTEISRLYDLWEDVRGFKVNRGTDFRMIEALGANPDISLILQYYSGHLLSYAIMLRLDDKAIEVFYAKYLSVLSLERLADYLGCSLADDRERVKCIKDCLGAYSQYFMHDKYLRQDSYQALYYSGVSGRKSLENYKQIYFKKCLYYDRVPIQEYIKSLEGDGI